MRRHHTGSGRRSVVPADWQAHHAGVIDQAVTDTACTVTIGPETGGAPVFNPTLGYSETPAATAVYTGPADVMVLSPRGSDNRQTVAEDQVAPLVYQVTLHADAAGLSTDHVIRVTAAADPDLVGRTLQVAEIVRGTRRFSRILLATLND